MRYKNYFDQLDSAIPLIMAEYDVPGMSVAITDPENVMFSGSYGYTDLSQITPISSSTQFSIQSISKTYTAFGFMLAVQDGKVSLDDPLKKYVSDFSVKYSDGEDYSSAITFRHLLKHRSGLAHEAPIGNNFIYGVFEEHIKSINETYLRFKPDEQYSYSNLGIDLAAYALQKVYGMPFDEYMRTKVFVPLEMENSTFNQNEFLLRTDSAMGHGKTSLIKYPISMLGAGGMYSCANDMAKFIICFLNHGTYHGKNIINQELLKQMYNQSPASKEWSYHLGLDVGLWNNRMLLNHNGGGFGFYATQDIFPEDGLGAAVLVNSVEHPNIQWKIIRNLWDDIFEMQNEGREDCIALDEHFSQYVGIYQTAYNGGTWKLAVYPRNGKLYCNNQELKLHKKDMFFNKSNDCFQFAGRKMIYNYITLSK